ncbi:MAG: ATP-binding protein [Faecalibacterium sp.]|jgi:DNA replication protein DnaC|nr:ATP-binding protein [Faecalibacterium sp.]
METMMNTDLTAAMVKSGMSFNGSSTYGGEEWEQHLCDKYNAELGKLIGYDCPICKNKGNLHIRRDGYTVQIPCKCMTQRKVQGCIDRSGMSKSMQRQTFAAFDVKAPWQQVIFDMGRAFLKESPGGWFYLSGQPGCGKTHIASAICNVFMRDGRDVLYFTWRDIVRELNAGMNTDEGNRMMQRIQSAPILYIDDFLKVRSGGTPTDGDCNKAIEIIYARYNDEKSTTLFTSEHSLETVLQWDDGMGSRIKERAAGYIRHIQKDPQKNMRFSK